MTIIYPKDDYQDTKSDSQENHTIQDELLEDLSSTSDDTISIECKTMVLFDERGKERERYPLTTTRPITQSP